MKMLPQQNVMSQVAKISVPTVALLTFAAFSAYLADLTLAARALMWMAGIKLINPFASKLPFPRLIHWAHALTFELLALIGVAFLRFVPTKEKIQGNGRPILLVHGYMNHSSVWVLFKKQMEMLGFGPIYMINLGHPFRSIRTYAERVQKKAEEIAKETGRNDLVLIGHSMGGLVSSLYAAALAPRNTVTDVITIGSPLNGTPVARIGLGPNAREMQPDSSLLKEMREAMSRRKDIRFFHLATKSDQLVIPGASAVIPENSNFIYEDLGHASLLYSPRTAHQVAEWIAN
ncbi:MAG: alpha/beta fold hydrolase [Parachlamydiales bacterium]|nr:alpha/beta fold hydrolase [Parachlamydiales bacterium]